MTAEQATVLERAPRLSYADVDRLCKKHLADRGRIDLAGARIVRYEPQETQRFAPAHAHVSAYLIERIDFDRAFKRLRRSYQEVLILWYGYHHEMTQAELARRWRCKPETVRKKRRRAVLALARIMNGEG